MNEKQLAIVRDHCPELLEALDDASFDHVRDGEAPSGWDWGERMMLRGLRMRTCSVDPAIREFLSGHMGHELSCTWRGAVSTLRCEDCDYSIEMQDRGADLDVVSEDLAGRHRWREAMNHQDVLNIVRSEGIRQVLDWLAVDYAGEIESWSTDYGKAGA